MLLCIVCFGGAPRASEWDVFEVMEPRGSYYLLVGGDFCRRWSGPSPTLILCLQLPIANLPTKNPPPPVSPVVLNFRSKLATALPARRNRSSRCLIDLLQPSMKCAAYQLFLTMSLMRSFSVSLFNFYCCHFLITHRVLVPGFPCSPYIVIVIKMRILSESLL